jgi:hypothetical protein
MTDLEITRACAEAMGYMDYVCQEDYIKLDRYTRYHPLHDDAQAMELVKKLNLSVNRHNEGQYLNWMVGGFGYFRNIHTENPEDLNRAICEAVAKMQAASSTHP